MDHLIIQSNKRIFYWFSFGKSNYVRNYKNLQIRILIVYSINEIILDFKIYFDVLCHMYIGISTYIENRILVIIEVGYCVIADRTIENESSQIRKRLL